jgi:hypothetical protein
MDNPTPSEPVKAALTVLVALGFVALPDRRRVRGTAERRLDLDSVRDDLAGIVQQALEPARISVWVPAAQKIRDTTASAARERRSPLASGGA